MPTPTTGTFTAIGTTVSLTGDTAWSFTVGDDWETMFQKGEADVTSFASKGVPKNYNISWGGNSSPDTSQITLNKGTVDEETFSFNGLPSGFVVTGLSIKITVESGVFGTVRKLKFYYNSSPVGNHLSFNLAVQTFTHVVTPTPSTIGTFFGTNFGFDSDGTGSSGASEFTIYSVWLEGTYELQDFSWYIKPTEKIVNGEPTIIIEDGDIIEIEPDEDVPEGFEFYGTSEDYPSGPVFIWWTNPNVYQFWIFSPITPGPDWTEFDGVPVCSECLTLTLGELTILIANASGIYYLQPDKRNDTLYQRDALGEQIGTVNVKISNPRGTTGLVP